MHAIVALGLATAGVGGQEPARAPVAGLDGWLTAIDGGIRDLLNEEGASAETWTASVLRLYLDQYEPLEAWYGPQRPHGAPELSAIVMRGESRFHALLQAREVSEQRASARLLLADVAAIRAEAREAGVPLVPTAPVESVEAGGRAIRPEQARTEEVRGMLVALGESRAAHEGGDAASALAGIESMYLQGFEPLEARLPGEIVRDVETLIHLTLRPQLARGAPDSEIAATFSALNAGLARVDEALAGGHSFWFTAVNAFAIIVREGLEAVLLVAAMLAYLTGLGAEQKARRRIWMGVVAGLVATLGTWVVASTLIPVSGANRELMEGVTALVAVAVLVYVSNWLFQKTYIDDWKAYLRERVGRAVTTGSAFAMAGLAFAAVYREGFETVLFYQTLLMDDHSVAVFAGFAPGLVLILLTGTAIIRLGVKLPLKNVFAITNGILVWLAFVFLGKGLYNLQEAGLFAPRPIRWLPDHEALRQLFGFYPLAETVLAQSVFITFIAFTWLFYRRRIAHLRAVSRAGIPSRG
ncbi:MAG: FTR1 family iron permease [Longimicrobiales bacterium]